MTNLDELFETQGPIIEGADILPGDLVAMRAPTGGMFTTAQWNEYSAYSPTAMYRLISRPTPKIPDTPGSMMRVVHSNLLSPEHSFILTDDEGWCLASISATIETGTIQTMFDRGEIAVSIDTGSNE